jgi:hypothetical protein
LGREFPLNCREFFARTISQNRTSTARDIRSEYDD